MRYFGNSGSRSACPRRSSGGTAKPVRIMGEDLTLYRGESGKPYLVGGRCAHRLTLLHTGWVQGGTNPLHVSWLAIRRSRKMHGTSSQGDANTPKIKIAGYGFTRIRRLDICLHGRRQLPEFQLVRKDVFEFRRSADVRTSREMALQLVSAS